MQNHRLFVDKKILIFRCKLFDIHNDFINAKDGYQSASESYSFRKRNCDDIKRAIEKPLIELVC